MVLAIESARILDRLGEEGGGFPGRPRVERFKSIKLEGNIRRGPRGNETARTKAHSESAGTQRQALIVGQIRCDINKRELQIERVVLHMRRRLPFPGIQT